MKSYNLPKTESTVGSDSGAGPWVVGKPIPVVSTSWQSRSTDHEVASSANDFGQPAMMLMNSINSGANRELGSEGYIDKEKEEGTPFEEAVEATGYGKFHVILLLICGWALSSDAIEVLSISFVLPPATCDLKLSSPDKGWLSAVIFIGMMIGGYLWGSLADIFGRRSVLLWSLTVNGLGGLASSFAQSFPLFIFLRFVSGIGVGGSLPVIFAYYTEFQGKSRRGSMVSLLATFWMSGNIVCSGLAWLVIPHESLGIFSPDFTFNSWRIFLAICTVPCISSALFFFILPESPRYLLQVDKGEEALKILRKMFKMNNPSKDVHRDFPVQKLRTNPRLKTEGDIIIRSPGKCVACCSKASHAMKKFFQSTGELFHRPNTKVTVILLIIYFTLSFGYYGLFMWFPELFNRMAITGGSPCSLGSGNFTQPNTTSCDVTVNMSIYLDSFLTAASNLPGNIFTFLVIDRLKNGRNILLASSMVVSGMCVFFIALLKTQTESLVMSCVFSAISVIGWNSLDVIGMEVYPTHLRSTANGLCMGLGRVASVLANVVFGELVTAFCLIPMLMVAVFLVIGGLSALKLPNKTGRDIS